MEQFVSLTAVTVCAMLALPHTTAAQPAPGIPRPSHTPDKVETSIGTLEFKDGAPSVATTQKVLDSLDYVRGVGMRS